MRPFNCLETIAILACKQINSNSFKDKILTNYSLTNHMYIHLNVCKQMFDNNVKLSCYDYIAKLENV